MDQGLKRGQVDVLQTCGMGRWRCGGKYLGHGQEIGRGERLRRRLVAGPKQGKEKSAWKEMRGRKRIAALSWGKTGGGDFKKKETLRSGGQRIANGFRASNRKS